MRKELDLKLVEKYPLIFKDRHAPMNQTAMCWGFSHGDGWYNIIDTLCSLLYSDYRQAESRYDFVKDKLGKPQWEGSTTMVTQEMIDEAKEKMEHERDHVPIASQVKEKFGGLRFYVQGAIDKHYHYISFAESLSYRTCEECGAPGQRYTDGWHRTLCDIHAAMDGRTDKYDEEDE